MTHRSIGTSGMTFDDVIAVARDNAKVVISDDALAAMSATRAHVEALAVSPEPVYGVSTGFGALAQRHIPTESRTQLQKSLIRSHAAGMGAPVETERGKRGREDGSIAWHRGTCQFSAPLVHSESRITTIAR